MTTTDCTPTRSTITPMTLPMTWPTHVPTVDVAAHASAYKLVPFRGRVAAGFGIENTQGTPVWRPPDW